MTAQSMESNNKFSLVKEAYPLEEARELLMSLLTGTTRFYSLNNLRTWERTGEKDQDSEKRVKELIKLRENILEMLNGVEEKDLSIEINAEVKVTAKSK